MYSAIITTVCLACVIIFIIVITIYSTGLKTNFDNKMRGMVDQINTSQFYQYELEKRSVDKLNTIDTNVANVRSSYLPKTDMNNRVITNALDVKDVIQHDGSMNIGGSLDFGNNMKMQGNGQNLNVNLPTGTSMYINNAAGNSMLTLDENMKTPYAQIDKIQVGNYLVNTDDTWLTFFDKANQGGIKTANLYSRDGASLNGNTQIKGVANVDGNMYMTGGASEHNPGHWQTHFPWKGDNKNYIRGDTELRGNNTNIGDLTVNRNLNVEGKTSLTNLQVKNTKVNHNFGGTIWDASPLSVYAPSGPGIIASGKEFSSLLPYNGDSYIRPGTSGGSIYLGDIGNTASVQLGDQNTVTKVNGKLCIQDVCITRDDLFKLKNKSGL